jgi:hypothetical protein
MKLFRSDIFGTVQHNYGKPTVEFLAASKIFSSYMEASSYDPHEEINSNVFRSGHTLDGFSKQLHELWIQEKVSGDYSDNKFRLRNMDFIGCIFDNVFAKNTHFFNCTFSDTWVKNSSFENCVFELCSFKSSSFYFNCFSHAEFNLCKNVDAIQANFNTI